MSGPDYRQAEEVEEQAWHEHEAKCILRGLEVLAEQQQSRDAEFAASLAEKFPILRAWPGKDQK